jgi:2-polyprenyl-3-methyl-5-hydroxy-6-metoxy-1,4-benzoquinol methylase
MPPPAVAVDYRLGERTRCWVPPKFDVVLALEVVEHVSDLRARQRARRRAA